MEVQLEKWLKQELELNQQHEEILMRREALLRGSEAYYDSQRTEVSSFISSTAKARERNDNLLRDLDHCTHSLQGASQDPGTPKFKTLKSNYWAMIRSVFPVWLDEVQDYKRQYGGRSRTPSPRSARRRERTPSPRADSARGTSPQSSKFVWSFQCSPKSTLRDSESNKQQKDFQNKSILKNSQSCDDADDNLGTRDLSTKPVAPPRRKKKAKSEQQMKKVVIHDSEIENDFIRI